MRMPRRAALVVVACLLVSLSLLAMPLTAQAAVYPCLFYGGVAVDGVAVDAGTEISAWIEGESVASATTGTGTLDSDQYCLAVEIEAPAEVSFKIGELWAVETATWVQYGEVEVDLTATSEPITVELYQGATPILYTGATTELPGALTNISDLAQLIWERDASTGGDWWYYLVALDYGQFTELENGKVYVVVVSEDCTWELP